MTWRNSRAYVRRLEAEAISIMREVAQEFYPENWPLRFRVVRMTWQVFWALRSSRSPIHTENSAKPFLILLGVSLT